jgi:aminoglycoside 2'-N-acetyltransferase I
MTALERIIRAAYDLGALASSEMAVGFYERRGWLRWPGPTAVLAPDGIRRTEDEDGAVYVLPVRAGLEPSGQLACDWRDGDVW